MYEIVEAKRDSAPITAAIIGGSGSGKTLSALLLARGLVGPSGKIVVIDTEGGRPKIYANDQRIGGFYIMDLPAPYRSDRFRDAYRAAEKWGEGKKLAIVIDTISHEHEGFLEYADQEEARIEGAKKSRNKWIKPKADRKRFYSAISSSHAHTIVTIRLNRIVDMESKPPKEIMKPECDKDLPYRLDLSMRLEKFPGSDKPQTIYIKVPDPLKPFVEDGVAIEVKHGAMLAADIDKQDAVSPLRSIVNNLEIDADGGIEHFKAKWILAWKATAPALRPELESHLDRLKRLAAEADKLNAEKIKAGEDGDPGEFPEIEGPDDDSFPGDRPSLFGNDDR